MIINFIIFLNCRDWRNPNDPESWKPPEIPQIVAGISEGKIYFQYPFYALTTDPNGDSVSYQFDWGDGTLSSWSEFVPSGDTGSLWKRWLTAGTFLVRVRAKDIKGKISEWSYSYLVTITAPDSFFFDDFNDGNADGWIEDDVARYRVENGEYSIESVDDGYQHRALREFCPQPLNNFLFNAKVKYVAGTGYVFGIGVLDTAYNLTCLFINKYGWFRLDYYKSQTDSWYTIKNWTFTNAIDTTIGRWNKLEMEKTGDFLKIAINDSFLGSFSANSIRQVLYAVLYVQNNFHIHFDDVRAKSKR